MSSPREDAFARLAETMNRLRRECPWDRSQTSRSILPYLIEETYEVLEAIETGSPDEVRDELGDLLLQIFFHSELASERGEFDVYDVADAVRTKMVRRHPHVFGELELKTAEEVLRNWSRIKAAEGTGGDARGGPRSVLDGVPNELPALLRAERLGEKASRVGFDWDDAAGVLAKVREEMRELEEAVSTGDSARIEHEIGDCLFALASLGRHAGASAELCLRRTLVRFRERFDYVESRLREQKRDIHTTPPADLEALWEEAKTHEPR